MIKQIIYGSKNILIKLLYILLIIYLLIFIPSIKGYKPLVVLSGSMEPLYKVGGLFYYKKENNFKEKDILVYRLNNHNISHRIISIKDNGYITKGDNNKNIDKNIVNKNILGKGVNFSIPYLGYYADFIYHHKYILYIIISIILTDFIYNRKELI